MIDIVIPVYRGEQQTRRCIESVLASVPATSGRVVVVDDASPEPGITGYVRGLAADGRVDLIENASNLGFVRSVNLAMSHSSTDDVVLLNSDTEVANDWLRRLQSAAHRASDIATATPFSNNATICSYPFLGWTGGIPGALGLARLDALFARTHAGVAIDIPTAVGFCMYIRRDALDAVGLFDADRFGRGYGEENDFCMRALKAGRRNVLAADVFVYHEGGVSFSAERAALMQAAARALLEVHPDYDERVAAFVASDPVQPLRVAIDRARAEESLEEAKHVLHEVSEQRAMLLGETAELKRYLAGREAHIAELHAGLAQATDLVKQRTAETVSMQAAISRLQAEMQAELDRLNTESARLREGLAYAESLAFERQKELEEIHSSWTWKLAAPWLRRSPRR